MSQSQVSQRFRGVFSFTLPELEIIAEWFSTSPAVLMGYATEPIPVRPQGLEPWTRRLKVSCSAN